MARYLSTDITARVIKLKLPEVHPISEPITPARQYSPPLLIVSPIFVKMLKGATKQPTRRSVTAKHPMNVFEGECKAQFFQITYTINALLTEAVIATRRSSTQVMMLVARTGGVWLTAFFMKKQVSDGKLWFVTIIPTANK